MEEELLDQILDVLVPIKQKTKSPLETILDDICKCASPKNVSQSSSAFGNRLEQNGPTNADNFLASQSIVLARLCDTC